MGKKRPQLANGEIYHIILRGIAGQNTFRREKDFLRYSYSLYKFNDKNVGIRALGEFFQGNALTELVDLAELVEKVEKEEKPRDLLIEILGFCLMPNHIHLLVRQLVDNGISLFFQKMGGYSTYFNKKYQRFGSLFQRPFKAVHIKTHDQLLIVITYIHMNPIDLIESNWKIKGISSPQKVMEFLESYLWSSYPYYLGKENFSWLVDSEFLKKILKTPKDFRNFVRARVSNKAELKNFLIETQDFSLE